MKFHTKSSAESFAKMETIVTHRKHVGVKTFDYHNGLIKTDCWTVILVNGGNKL